MSKTKPLLVGITGGIGSGKSTVCQVFELLGIPVYYADDRAKMITTIDPELKRLICERFGEDAYIGDSLNKSYLAEKVFSDKDELKALNSLIHPRVALDFENWVSENNDQHYLLKEAALIFETKGESKLDKVVTVTADEPTRIKRVLNRDSHRTEQDIKNIIDNQMSEEQKISLSDAIINNNGDQLIIPQILRFHEEIITSNRNQEV